MVLLYALLDMYDISLCHSPRFVLVWNTLCQPHVSTALEHTRVLARSKKKKKPCMYVHMPVLIHMKCIPSGSFCELSGCMCWHCSLSLSWIRACTETTACFTITDQSVLCCRASSGWITSWWLRLWCMWSDFRRFRRKAFICRLFYCDCGLSSWLSSIVYKLWATLRLHLMSSTTVNRTSFWCRILC